MFLSPPLLTCADVHDMVEGVHALNNVHDQVGEANVILHDQRINRLRLDHVVHQVEPLGILQAALRQTLVGTLVIYSTTLKRKGNGVRKERRVRCQKRNVKMCYGRRQMKKEGRKKKEKLEKCLTHPVTVRTKSIHTAWLVCFNS